jgi:hypothetical protein
MSALLVYHSTPWRTMSSLSTLVWYHRSCICYQTATSRTTPRSPLASITKPNHKSRESMLPLGCGATVRGRTEVLLEALKVSHSESVKLKFVGYDTGCYPFDVCLTDRPTLHKQPPIKLNNRSKVEACPEQRAVSTDAALRLAHPEFYFAAFISFITSTSVLG